MQKKTVIVDVGVCNIFNISRAVKSLGVDTIITRSPREIEEAQYLILPGVGAFGAAMQSLNEGDLISPIQKFAKSGKPILGICLGMQLLMTHSEELGSWQGLDLIEGKVVQLTNPDPQGPFYKVPQMGWNTIEPPDSNSTKDIWKGTILDDLGPEPFFYFVHSLVVQPESENNVLALTNYGNNYFCSVIKQDNISACQFHLERSADVGLKILSNFLKLKY